MLWSFSSQRVKHGTSCKVKTANYCKIQYLKKILHTTYLEIQIASKTLSFKKYLGKGVEILNIKVPLVVINDNLF